MTDVTTQTFDQAIASSTPVLVDFWAEWCGPCRALTPILSDIAAEQAGRVEVVKLNVDEHPGVAQRFNVTGIPTMILFQGGETKLRMTGLRSKAQLLKELEPHLA